MNIQAIGLISAAGLAITTQALADAKVGNPPALLPPRPASSFSESTSYPIPRGHHAPTRTEMRFMLPPVVTRMPRPTKQHSPVDPSKRSAGRRY